jgi:DNA-binding NtrC family response regulator
MSGAILRIPALRDRREDIPVLVNTVLERTCERLGKPGHRVSSRSMEEMMAHDWPGNLTELECVLEESLAVATHREIRPGNLRQFLWRDPSEAARTTAREVLSCHIEEVLKRSGGNVRKAAAVLGMPRSSLYRKLKDLK